jgi:hypothetical protein
VPNSHSYAVIMQYPGDGQLEANRVKFFDDVADAVAWRDQQDDDWFKVFRVEPVQRPARADAT